MSKKSETATPRWVKNKWSGLDNYQCQVCPFATLDHDEMERHAHERHPIPSDPTPPEGPANTTGQE